MKSSRHIWGKIERASFVRNHFDIIGKIKLFKTYELTGLHNGVGVCEKIIRKSVIVAGFGTSLTM